MLVSGTGANALLTALLTAEQQPHLVFPISIEPLSAFELNPAGDSGSGHRRRQVQGAEPEPEPESDVAGIRVYINTQASSGKHRDKVAGAIAARYPDCGGPGSTTSEGAFDYTECRDRAFAVCHDTACDGHEGNRARPQPSFVSGATPAPAPVGGGKGRRLLSFEEDDAAEDLVAENRDLKQQLAQKDALLQQALAELERCLL